VNHDENARRSIRGRRPLVDVAPRSDAAVYITRVARKLVNASSAAAQGETA
jgi:hypothetical protein